MVAFWITIEQQYRVASNRYRLRRGIPLLIKYNHKHRWFLIISIVLDLFYSIFWNDSPTTPDLLILVRRISTGQKKNSLFALYAVHRLRSIQTRVSTTIIIYERPRSRLPVWDRQDGFILRGDCCFRPFVSSRAQNKRRFVESWDSWLLVVYRLCPIAIYSVHRG